MSSIDIEYAIKKDIRNNPVVREVDERQRRDMRQTIGLAVLIVGMLLFSAWQSFRMVDHGIQLEKLRVQRAQEESLNRQLTLQLETLRAPQTIEERAKRELHLVAPTPADTVIVERAPAAPAPRAIVASAR